MRRPHSRHIILALGLLASLGAALWAPGKEDEQESVVTAVARQGGTPSPVAAPDYPARLPLERLNPRTLTATDIDPFRAKAWFAPPPPAPPPAPPPKPTAPPLPFQYVGKSEDVDGGNGVAFLAKGNQSFTVKPGEKFDGVYQFEGIEKGNLVILYLPLAEKQRLPMGTTE